MSIVRAFRMTPPADALDRVEAIVQRMRPILAGEHPAVIGAALVQVHAMLLAGRALGGELDDAEIGRLIQLHADTVRDLVPETKAELARQLKQAMQ